MLKVRATDLAVVKVRLPSWCAVTVQLPPKKLTLVIVTVVPAIVQSSLTPTVKVTSKPELAVALTVNGGSPTVLLDNDANVIVWLGALRMAKVCATDGAALKFALPACDAVTVQLPNALMRIVVGARCWHAPLGALNVTTKPELAVALTVKFGSPTTLGGSAANVIA